MNITNTLLPFLSLSMLSMSSCVVPVETYDQPVTSVGVGYYSVLPAGFIGDTYYCDGRYYYGGRYETGRYHHHGRYYDNRYYHRGRYYYGGHRAHHNGHGHHH